MSPQPLGSRYLLEEQIGRGGMGVVWRGRDRTSGAVYAIKVLRPEYAADASALARFVRERTALTAFHHPNVVTLHDMIVEGDKLALVMDLVPGGDLDELRRRQGGRLAPEEAARLAAQIADALAAAHRAGIVHRDLKPANVLMDGGRALLADFGIARLSWQSRDTTTGTVLGTAAYLSPEMISGDEPGPEGDVYALGATLYELVAGQPPFTGNPAAVLHAHIHTAPARPGGIGDALWQLISRCLAKDPGRRPSAAELAAALPALAGDPGQKLAAAPELAAGPGEKPAAVAPRVAEPGGAPVAWPGRTGPFHEVRMRPVPEAGDESTVQIKRRVRPLVAVAGSVLVVVAVIAAVLVVNPFKSATVRPASAGSLAAPADATTSAAADQPSATARAKPKASVAGHADATPRAASAKASTAAGTSGVGTTAKASSSASPKSDDTGWECSATSKQDTTNGKYVKSCIKIDGTTVHLEGYAWPIPDLPSSQYEQVEIVLHTPSGDVGHYTSPHCAAGTCEYCVSVTEPADEYWAQADYLWDGINEYQGGFTAKVTVTG